MKKQLLLIVSLWTGFLQAQSIVSEASGTDLSIAAGTPFSAGTLALIPNAGFVMNRLIIIPSATVAHNTAITYASRLLQDGRIAHLTVLKWQSILAILSKS